MSATDDSKQSVVSLAVDEEPSDKDDATHCRTGRFRKFNVATSVWKCLIGNGAYFRPPGGENGRRGREAIRDGGESDEGRGDVNSGVGSSPSLANSVSRLDKTSRLLFPVLFITFHVFYWSLYADSSSYSTTALTGVQSQAT